MPNKRPIPSVDTKNYAEPGAIYFKPYDKHVVIEMHHCSSFLSEAEALRAILSFIKAGKEVWGDEFLGKTLAHMENL